MMSEEKLNEFNIPKTNVSDSYTEKIEDEMSEEKPLDQKMKEHREKIRPIYVQTDRKRVFIPEFQMNDDWSIAWCAIEQTDVKTADVKKVYFLEPADIAQALAQYVRFNKWKIRSKKIKWKKSVLL